MRERGERDRQRERKKDREGGRESGKRTFVLIDKTLENVLSFKYDLTLPNLQ